MVEEKKFYTCKNDIAFKEVFMEEKNSDLLKALLESILDIKIKNIKYLNLEKNNGNIHIKRKNYSLIRINRIINFFLFHFCLSQDCCELKL